MREIKIFDTTLRDGEQSPGCSMNLQEKLEVALRLEALGVDVMEAGFPIASPDDFAAVKVIAETITKSTVAGLARATKEDIDRAWEAVGAAKKPRIHTFIATSPIHMEYKLKMTPDEVLARTTEMVAYAKSLCDDIEFSAEDASRSDRAFLKTVYEAAIKAGATTINVPDTVGYLMPSEMHDLVSWLKANVEGIGSVDVSMHCHNDLGLAVANSLAAVEAGATQVECTLNGIGERAGNASLEEVVMAIKTRRDFFNAKTNIDTHQIFRASRTLSGIIGVPVAPNKPIVGANAFAHEAGIHQHGMLANAQTYEIMKPEDIGIPANKMVLGKHSGRHAFTDRIVELGFDLSKDEIETVFTKFKTVADRKKIVSDDDIIALIEYKKIAFVGGYEVARFTVNNGNTIAATATIKLTDGGREIEEASTGDGPINAAFNAIDRIVGVETELLDFSIRSVGGGEDALGEAVVKLQHGAEIVTGRGLSTDIIEASIKAYVNGINKMTLRSERVTHPQNGGAE